MSRQLVRVEIQTN